MSDKHAAADSVISFADGEIAAPVASAELTITNEISAEALEALPDPGRSFSFSITTELDPRLAEELFEIDTHPMPRSWRERHR